jgi:pimeloyl-ACP methyl ester carboxylesterase
MGNLFSALLSFVVVTIAGAANARGQDPNSPSTWLHDALHSANRPSPTIVLVHGASTGASSWQYIVPILRKDGYKVIAVENPLSSLAGDIATTRSVIDAQKDPVVVVGHSYGGAVITGAAAGSLNVKALVYLAAFAPDANEPIGAFTRKYPSATGAALPANPAILNETISFPAWRSIPSWYLVSREDRAISPSLERFYAKRMGATTSEVNANHLAIISQPKTVARFIEEAAAATRK